PAPIAEGNSDSLRLGTTTLHRLEHSIISDEFRQQHRVGLAVPMEARYSAGRPYCWWLVASHVLHLKQLQSHYRWRFDWVPTWPIGFVCRRQISQQWWASSSGLRAELDIHTLDAECRPSKIAPARFASPAQIADLRRGLIRKGTDRPVCKSTFDIVMKPCEVHFSRARLVPRLTGN